MAFSKQRLAGLPVVLRRLEIRIIFFLKSFWEKGTSGIPVAFIQQMALGKTWEEGLL